MPSGPSKYRNFADDVGWRPGPNTMRTWRERSRFSERWMSSADSTWWLMCWMPARFVGNSAIVWCTSSMRSSGASPMRSDTRALHTVVQNASSRTGSVLHSPTCEKPVMPASRVPR